MYYKPSTHTHTHTHTRTHTHTHTLTNTDTNSLPISNRKLLTLKISNGNSINLVKPKIVRLIIWYIIVPKRG